MRISDWSSDVCSSDLRLRAAGNQRPTTEVARWLVGRAREHAFKSPFRLLLGLTFTQALRVAQGVEKRAAGHRQTKAFQNRREARHRLEVIGRAVEKLEIGSASCRENVCQ